MPAHSTDPFGARRTLSLGSETATIYRLDELQRKGLARLDRLPFSIRVLLENLLRFAGRGVVTEDHVRQLAAWSPAGTGHGEIPFMPARVVLQDFTGVPCVVDLAAMRDAMARLGGDPNRINPIVPCDLVIDHSVQVDYYGTGEAYRLNVQLEFERNRERYQLLKFAQRAFDNFRVVPPGTGIVHQVNLEYLAPVVQLRPQHGELTAYPDTLVGTDSHTTMINGLGVLGWGVGGIEAEAVMLGQPYFMLVPAVVGLKLTGELRPGTTATDLVLTVTRLLREKGVVDQFVEFYGPGLSNLSLADRATIANMAPEYGATTGFFPVDAETLRYLERTGRDRAVVERVERYCKEQGLFRTDGTPDPEFSDTLELDLSTVVPSLAGPRRPQDLVPLTELKRNFQMALPDLMTPAVPAARRELAEANYSRWVNEGGGGGGGTGGGGRGGAGGPARGPGHGPGEGRRTPGRLGGDRGHHELYQHLEPVGDDRGGVARPQGGREGTGQPALGEDQSGSRVAGRDRVSPGVGPAALPGAARVRGGGLRLYHLHRQLRAPARPRGPGDRGACAGHRRSPVGKPELRGPGASAGAGQLSRLADAGGGLRAGGPH